MEFDIRSLLFAYRLLNLIRFNAYVFNKVDLPNFEVFHLLLLYPMESFEPENILMVSFKRNLYPIMKNLNIQNCQNMLPEIQMHTGIDFEQL